MEMDIQLSLIAIGVACATAVAVYIVSVVGIREKSFEEAIAEQKKMSNDLLGHHPTKKEKKKDKGSKEKGANKKLKKREKQNNNVAVSDLSDVGDVGGGKEGEEDVVVSEGGRKEKKSGHVEIVDEPEMIEDEEEGEGGDGDEVGEGEKFSVPRPSSRRSSLSATNRRDSIIKPILLNKDESPCVSGRQDVEPANNFEQSHPKDDCELKKEKSTENIHENVSTPPSPRVGNKSSGSNTPVDEMGTTDSPQVNKRSKSRGNRKVVEDDQSITAPKIEKIIDKLPLTSSEIQNLIDVLLNKQHAGDSEWVKNTKGGNSVGDLKKQLEVKDKMLEEEKNSVRGLQDKLKELRNEFSGDKSKFAGVRRSLEEQLQGKGVEVQNLIMRLRQVEAGSLNEKGELQKQLQRMQIKFKDVQEEYEAIKGDYRNYRDAEQTIRSKADTLERESGALKTQCGHLENQLKNAFASNQEMSNQLRSLQEHMRGIEERKKEQEIVMQNEYRKLQEREGVLLNELSGLKSTVGQMENENQGLRAQVNALEGNAKGLDEVNSKYEEVRKSEVALKNVVNELKSSLSGVNEVVKEKDGRVGELEREVERLRGEVSVLESGKVNGEVKGEEVEGLRKELDGLRGEVKRLEGEVDGGKVKNDELRHRNQKLVESLNVTEQSLQSRIESGAEVGSLRGEVERLRGEVKELEIVRKSERELREELNDIKTRLVARDATVVDAVENLKRVKNEMEVLKVEVSGENERRKEKALPLVHEIIGGGVDLSSEDWLVIVLTRVQEKIAEVKSASTPAPAPQPENNGDVDELKRKSKELADEVAHYQGMLKETETLLSNLQASLNEEEGKWSAINAEKDGEIERLRGEVGKVAELEERCRGVVGGGDLEELKKVNETLSESLDSSKLRVEELTRDLQSANNRIASLESSVPRPSTPQQQQHPPETNGSPVTNGSSTEPLNASSSNKSPQQAPPSPSGISTASAVSGSPPVKEKKKKKGTKKQHATT